MSPHNNPTEHLNAKKNDNNLTRRFTHLVIPAEIWLHKGISIQAKALWAELYSLHDEEVGGCYASVKYLCQFMGLKERRLYYVLNELKEAGLVDSRPLDEWTTIRTATFPMSLHQTLKENVNDIPQKSSTTVEKCRGGVHKSAGGGCRKLQSPHYIESKEDRKDRECVGAAPPTPPHTHKSFLISSFPDIEQEITYVKLTQKDYDTFLKKLGKTSLNDYICRVDDHCKNNRPKGYVNYASAIRTFMRLDQQKKTSYPSSGGRSNVRQDIADAQREAYLKHNSFTANVRDYSNEL